MFGLKTFFNNFLESYNFEHDTVAISEMLIKTHPFLKNCPQLIQTICSETKSKHTLHTINSLVTKAVAGTDSRIGDNLTELLQIYKENPLCHTAKTFLEQFREHIEQLLDHPEQTDEKFGFFEQQSNLSPLVPFFNAIRKELEVCSRLPKHLFQLNFEKAVYKKVLISLVLNEHKNFIHQSSGHCTGSIISKAVPLRGTNAAFLHTIYNNFNFFTLYFDRSVTSNFGKIFLETDSKVLVDNIPIASKIISQLLEKSSQAKSDHNELIGRIAAGQLFGNAKTSIDEMQIIFGIFKSDFDLKVKNQESFKIVGSYILNHHSEFEEIFPAEVIASMLPEEIGEWAYNLTTDVKLRHLPCWHILSTMFSQVNKIVSLSTHIERRGLKYVEILEFDKPFAQLESDLNKINFKKGDHYEITLIFKGGQHVLSLKFEENFFTFIDPNHYDPITHEPVNQVFGNKRECFSFINIFISQWYVGEKKFHLSKYSEISTSTPQMREYQFGQNLAKRSSILNEVSKLNSWCKLMEEKLATEKSPEEREKIYHKIAQIKGKLEGLQKNELHQFKIKNRSYIEEKISIYSEKNKINPRKSYALVIQSLKNLLA